MARRPSLAALAALAVLAAAPSAAHAARLVPVDARLGTALAINDQGWIVGRPTVAGGHLLLWRNGPLERLDPAPGETLGGPVFFSGDGTRVLAQSRPAPTPDCSETHPVVYVLGAAGSTRIDLLPLAGECGAWATGFADDVPVGMARRTETVPGLAEIGVPPGEFTTLRPMIRAVRWSRTGGAPSVDGTPPAPIISGTDFRTAQAVTFHTRLIAANAAGDVLAQQSAMTWRPDPFDWFPTIPLPVVEWRHGASATEVPLNGAGPDDVIGNPGVARDLGDVLVLGDAGQVLAGRSYWQPGGTAQIVPFGARGMSPTGRVVGNELVTTPGATLSVFEARGWFGGRVTDLAATARQVSPAQAALRFSSEGPASRKGYALAGCPLAAFQAGGTGANDPRCQRFRLDLVSIIAGQAVAPAPPVLAAARAPRPAAGVVLSATDGTTIVTATSGRDGRFALELPAGTWRVSVAGGRGCVAAPGGACRGTAQVVADGIANGTLAVRADPPGAATGLAARRAAVRRGTAALRVTCRHLLGCSGTLALRAARGTTAYGTKRVALRFGTQTVRVPLSRAAKRRLAAAPTLAARASLAPARGRALALGRVVLAR